MSSKEKAFHSLQNWKQGTGSTLPPPPPSAAPTPPAALALCRPGPLTAFPEDPLAVPVLPNGLEAPRPRLLQGGR